MAKRYPAPAKINLFLHICGKRIDGYHDLQTVFQFLDIHDDIEFTITDTPDLKLLTPLPGIQDDDNLVIKAAKLLQEKTACQKGAAITIHKSLPVGGGIGGGSSNAATTLVALNELWQLHLDKATLCKMATSLGADVPIFVHGHAAWAEGIGEMLTDVDPIEAWYVLLIPDCHVSTPAIFSHPELTRNSKMLKIAAFLEQGSSSQFQNDCEPLVRKLYPDVDEAFRLLSQYGQARLTGTGACIFARFDTREKAQHVLEQLPPHANAILTRGVNQSPLYQSLSPDS